MIILLPTQELLIPFLFYYKERPHIATVISAFLEIALIVTAVLATCSLVQNQHTILDMIINFFGLMLILQLDELVAAQFDLHRKVLVLRYENPKQDEKCTEIIHRQNLIMKTTISIIVFAICFVNFSLFDYFSVIFYLFVALSLIFAGLALATSFLLFLHDVSNILTIFIKKLVYSLCVLVSLSVVVILPIFLGFSISLCIIASMTNLLFSVFLNIEQSKTVIIYAFTNKLK
jgi:hypothetical protein